MALQISMAAYFLSPICQTGAVEAEKLKGLSKILNWWRKVVKEKRLGKRKRKEGKGKGKGKKKKDMDRGFFHFLWRCLRMELMDLEGLKVS